MKRYWALAVLISLGACSKSIVIQTDQVNELDLNKYKTFKFVENDSKYNLTFNEANKERIQFYIGEELQERNYVESDLADIHIKILGNIEMVRETAARNNYYGPYNPYYSPYWGRDYHGPRSENESALIINIIDGSTKKLIWQGVATGNFKQKKQHIESVIAETINAIFEEFPYKAHE